jgi:antitoxin (DNA-binding transcriptional repressor) of toxin-antitoxin stability system
MLKKIGTDDMRKKMGEILDCVNLRGDEFIIERKNKPIAGLIPMQKMISLQALAKNFLLDFLNENEALDLSDEEVAKLSDEAKHHVRSKQN